MSDRRYGTSAWQRVRKAVLRRDGHQCMIRGPRCRGIATTVHHRIPSSERPDLFFASDNLIAACTTCNYGGGSRARADNERRRIEQLEEIIVDQHEQIQRLMERLGQCESERPTPPPQPAIY